MRCSTDRLMPPGTGVAARRNPRTLLKSGEREFFPLHRSYGAMAIAAVHVSAADLERPYEPVGDVLYLSAVRDDKRAQRENPGGRCGSSRWAGRVTQLTAINAKWHPEWDGELVATLRDGRAAARQPRLRRKTGRGYDKRRVRQPARPRDGARRASMPSRRTALPCAWRGRLRSRSRAPASRRRSGAPPPPPRAACSP